MSQRDFAALDSYQLVPRLLHAIERADSRTRLLDRDLASPIVPLLEPGHTETTPLYAVDADRLLAAPEPPPGALPRLRSDPMGVLMPKVRKLVALDVPGLILDLTPLADTPPFGDGPWRPHHRDELAELRAAVGRPLWLLGVLGPADAEVAAEAGLDAVVVHAGVARRLGGPAAIDALPDVIDAVAGMLGVYAGGPVRDGLDVFRYLAVGAEAVLAESDRPLAMLEAELDYALRMTGCETLADVSYEAIYAPLFGEI